MAELLDFRMMWEYISVSQLEFGEMFVLYTC